jgi:hypothetical protein
MDAERLDFARGALDVVVGRDGQEWILPLAAVRAASRDLVELRRPWSALPARRFEPDAFDRVAHFTVHRPAGAPDEPAAPLELRIEEVVLRRSRPPVGAVAAESGEGART